MTEKITRLIRDSQVGGSNPDGAITFFYFHHFYLYPRCVEPEITDLTCIVWLILPQITKIGVIHQFV